MDLAILNNAVLTVWGSTTQVTVGSITHKLQGVYNDAYAIDALGNTAVEKPEPSFSFRTSEFNRINAGVGDTILHDGITYPITSDPVIENANWLSVEVGQYA